MNSEVANESIKNNVFFFIIYYDKWIGVLFIFI